MPTQTARITDPGQLRTHLLAYRRAQKLTQADLAVRLGVTKQRISAIEAAPDRITVAQFIAVLRALKVELQLAARTTADDCTNAPVDW